MVIIIIAIKTNHHHHHHHNLWNDILGERNRMFCIEFWRFFKFIQKTTKGRFNSKWWIGEWIAFVSVPFFAKWDELNFNEIIDKLKVPAIPNRTKNRFEFETILNWKKSNGNECSKRFRNESHRPESKCGERENCQNIKIFFGYKREI